LCKAEGIGALKAIQVHKLILLLNCPVRFD
jgi:hypothetical protein